MSHYGQLIFQEEKKNGGGGKDEGRSPYLKEWVFQLNELSLTSSISIHRFLRAVKAQFGLQNWIS